MRLTWLLVILFAVLVYYFAKNDFFLTGDHVETPQDFIPPDGPSTKKVKSHNVKTPKIKKPKVPKKKKDRDNEETIERFMQWVLEQGAEFKRNVTLEPFPGFGLGLKAHEYVPKGTIYLTMPYNLLIGRDNIMNDKFCGHIFRELTQNFGEDIKMEIMLYILYNKHVLGKNSYFYPFFAILPENFNNCPIFYEDKILNLMKGSDLYNRVHQQRVRYRNQYEGIRERVFQRYPDFFPPHKIDYREWLWVNWIFSSRLFFIEGRKPREHLLPLADMVNCEEPTPRDDSLTFVEDTGTELILRTDRNFMANSQIFESYGYKSNSESLQYEGFILENTPNDCVWFNLPFKKEAIDRFGYRGPPEFCFSATGLKNNNLPGRSVEYLRWFVSKDSVEANKSGFRSQENDKRFLELLKNIVENKILANKYGTTSKSKNEHLAIRFMRFEKKQLRRLKRAIEEKLRMYR